MKLLDVCLENGYLVIKTDNGFRRRSVSRPGADWIREKARRLIGKQIATTTSGSWDPQEWFDTVDEAPLPQAREDLESKSQYSPSGARTYRPDVVGTLRSDNFSELNPCAIVKPATLQLELLQLRAESGDVEAQYEFARAFDEGVLVPRNLIKAVDWYKRAASQGHSGASRALGFASKERTQDSPNSARQPLDQVFKIYGPPGTGKTTALLEKVKQALASGANPSEIGFFSYTNKATDEAKSRMVEEFQTFDIEKDFPYFRTIHSLAVQSLRTKVVVITDRQAKEFDQDVFIERPLMKEGDESSQVVRVKHPVLDACSTARAKKASLREYLLQLPESHRWPINKWRSKPKREWNNPLNEFDIEACVEYRDQYEKYKAALGVIDYTDMLEHALVNNAGLPRLKLLLIDEAQDLNPLQWDLARILMERSERCYVAGDDDQAICEPFGASAKHFVELPVKPDNEIVLTSSNRLPPAIHSALAPLIKKLDDRFPYRKAKPWKPKAGSHDGKVGRFATTGEFFESIFPRGAAPSGKSLLLMVPTNATLEAVSGRLQRQGVAHFAANKLVGTGMPQIRLLTIWGAKGGQAHVTALIAETDMDYKMLHDDPRLEYVAHTRALEEYYFVSKESAATGALQVAQEPARVESGRAGGTEGLSQESLDRLAQKYGQSLSSRSKRAN